MEKFRSNARRYSPPPAPVAVGLKINSPGLLDPVQKKVVILRKTIQNRPCFLLALSDVSTGAGCDSGAPDTTRCALPSHTRPAGGSDLKPTAAPDTVDGEKDGRAHLQRGDKGEVQGDLFPTRGLVRLDGRPPATVLCEHRRILVLGRDPSTDT